MKPTIPQVIERFRAYYAKHPMWGALHIVLADQNIRDSHVQWSIDHAEGDMEGIELGKILLSMSKKQRLKLSELIS